MGISTHILDTTRGRPATGVDVKLEREVRGAWISAGGGSTDADGRVKALLSADQKPSAGIYRLSFDVGPYFEGIQTESFYPSVHIVFRIMAPDQHYHVPLLLNPYGYSTYRGS